MVPFATALWIENETIPYTQTSSAFSPIKNETIPYTQTSSAFSPSLKFKILHDIPANFSFLITIAPEAGIRYTGAGMVHNSTKLTIETDNPAGPVSPIPFAISPALYPAGNFTHARVSFVPARPEAGEIISLHGEFVATMSLNPGDDLTLVLRGFVGPCNVLACPAGSFRTGCNVAQHNDSFCKACTFQPPPDSSLSTAVPFDEDACSFECDAGFYRNASGCLRCNTNSCPAGQYRHQCGVGELHDAQCVSCSRVNNSVLLEVPCTPGSAPNGTIDCVRAQTDSCDFVCVDNYFKNGTVCSKCNATMCPAGSYRASCGFNSTADAGCLPCSRPPENSTLDIATVFNTDTCGFICNPSFFKKNLSNGIGELYIECMF